MMVRKPSDRPVALFAPSSGAGEAFRILRANLQHLNRQGTPVRTILMTSPGWSEGKTLLTANLALVFAQAGVRVLAIDANLRRPALSRIVTREAPVRGLTSLLTETEPLSSVLLKGPWPGLDILPAGQIPANPAELLASKTMWRLLADLPKAYDLVLIDTPPVLECADAVALSPRTDGALLVLRAGQTTVPHAKRARDLLTGVGARMLGVVLDGVKSERAGA